MGCAPLEIARDCMAQYIQYRRRQAQPHPWILGQVLRELGLFLLLGDGDTSKELAPSQAQPAERSPSPTPGALSVQVSRGGAGFQLAEGSPGPPRVLYFISRLSTECTHMYYLGVQRCDPLAQARRDSTVAQHTRQPLRQPGRGHVGGQVGTQCVLLPERRI